MIPAGAESSAFLNLVWWLLAIATVGAAIMVAQFQDIFKAALALVASFLGVVGFFVMLNAEFLAAVQLLIYVGAVSILIVFAILMTRDVQRGNPSNRLKSPALLLSISLISFVIFVVLETEWSLLAQAAPSVQEEATRVLSDWAPWIGRLLVKEFVLPFEAVSVLLVAALVGAIVLARES